MHSRRLLSIGYQPCNTTVHGTCEQDADVGRSLMALSMGIILALSLGTNGVVCLVFYKKSYLLSVSNSFVLNLSCCQLAVSLLVMPFVLASIFSAGWIFNETFCQVQAFFFTICVMAIQISLSIISVDRNYAIINSLRYPYVFTQKLGNSLISVAWIISLLFAVPPLIGWGEYSYYPDQYLCGINWSKSKSFLISWSIGCFCIPLLLQSWCYLSIFRAAIGHTKRSSRVFPSMPSTIRDPPSDSSESSENSQRTRMGYKNVECKAMRTILLIACAYAICWVPYLVVSIGNLNEKKYSSEMNSFAVCLLFCSGIVNPVIYAFMNRVTRYEINKFFCDGNKVNGPTTTGNDSDEFYSTSMTNFSSTKQSFSVWTTQHRSRPGPRIELPVRMIDMNTIDESAELENLSPEGTNANLLQVRNDAAISDSEKEIVLRVDEISSNEKLHKDCATQAESSLTNEDEDSGSNNDINNVRFKSIQLKPETSDNFFKQRVVRARSEFLTGGDTFMEKSAKDCGSFLYFESISRTHRSHHHHHHRRLRSNSHFHPTRHNPEFRAYDRCPNSDQRVPRSHNTMTLPFKRIVELRNDKPANNLNPSDMFLSDPSLGESMASDGKLDWQEEYRERSMTSSSDSRIKLQKERERTTDY